MMSIPFDVNVALVPIRMLLPPTTPEVVNAIFPACLIFDCWNGGTGDPFSEPDAIVTLLPTSMSPRGLNALRATVEPPVSVLLSPTCTLPAPILVRLKAPEAAENVEPVPVLSPLNACTLTPAKLPFATTCDPAPKLA